MKLTNSLLVTVSLLIMKFDVFASCVNSVSTKEG
jgi:hypothetical protein